MSAYNLPPGCMLLDIEGTQPDTPERGYGTDPDDDAAKRRADWGLPEPLTPNPNWQVTVQSEQRMWCGAVGITSFQVDVPDYVQIDDVIGGQNHWSKSPETLRKEGFGVPQFERLPQGRYTWAEAREMLRREGGHV